MVRERRGGVRRAATMPREDELQQVSVIESDEAFEEYKTLKTRRNIVLQPKKAMLVANIVEKVKQTGVEAPIKSYPAKYN